MGAEDGVQGVVEKLQSEAAVRRRLRRKMGSRNARKTGTRDRVMRSGQRNKNLRPRPRVALARKYREYLAEQERACQETST